MTRYRIAYGPKQRDDLIEAEEYHTDAGWYSFVDADDREIMRIRQNDVQSIGLASARQGPAVA